MSTFRPQAPRRASRGRHASVSTMMTPSERRIAVAAAVQLALWAVFELGGTVNVVGLTTFLLVWYAGVAVGLMALVTSVRRGPGYSLRTQLLAITFLLLEAAFMISVPGR